MTKKANPKFRGKDPEKLRILQNNILGEMVSTYCQKTSSSSKKPKAHEDNIKTNSDCISSSDKTA